MKVILPKREWMNKQWDLLRSLLVVNGIIAISGTILGLILKLPLR